ncbi:alpha/beta hydrolase [Actinoplanes sp. NPDC023801]|uniref:alpha/beta fold hydrolase n=1 Tax=Actinoplanes sp. NPDC023801 TaxID=3154595 RepID=UPI00340DBB84
MASGGDPSPHPGELVQDLDGSGAITTGTLDLNGIAIEYDARGSGPPLLLVPGGSGHAGVLDRLLVQLADSCRVVAMSSRVASAVRPGSVDEEQDPRVHAQDTVALIGKLFDEPPSVFGFSAGAVTTLELLARHPGHVRLAVVHEPPVVTLLPDAARHPGDLEAVRAAARTDGPAAVARLMTAAMTAPGTDAPPVELRHAGDWLHDYAGTQPEPPTPELLDLFARLAGLQPLFLEHILVPFTTARLDLAALRREAARLVPVAGIDSRGQLPYRAAAALATRLGLPLTELPGGHLGPVERPAQFARALRVLLDERQP